MTVAACAREEPPPGTGPDFAAPAVRQLRPDHRSVVPGFDGQAQVEFDEPIANVRELTREVFASPDYRYRVEATRAGLRIRPEEGWRDGVVYFIQVPAGVRDLLNNRTETPVELLFSTGPSVPDTRVEGSLMDPVTGRPMTGGRVHFVAADSVPYAAVSDTGGRFRLPGLPPGRYRAIGFVDLNANRFPDRSLEPHDSAEVVLEGPGAAAQVALRPTEPDTTPPVLGSASALDSLTLRLEFDDWLRPESAAEAEVRVWQAATGRAWPVEAVAVGDALPPGEGREGEAGEPDEEPAEEAERRGAPDARGEPTGEEVGAEPGAEPVEELAGAPQRPSRRVSARLGEPLVPGEWRVEASGVRNLRGLVGGGEASFTYEPPPAGPEEEAVRDERDPAAGPQEGAAPGEEGEAPSGEEEGPAREGP